MLPQPLHRVEYLQSQSLKWKKLGYPQSQMIPLPLKKQSPVNLKSPLNHYTHSLSLEDSTGSSQLAVVGSMAGLLLLLIAIVGGTLFFIL